MATLNTVYRVWHKRRNRKEGGTWEVCYGTFDTLEEARDCALNLDEENVKIWKHYRISELVEDIK